MSFTAEVSDSYLTLSGQEDGDVKEGDVSEKLSHKFALSSLREHIDFVVELIHTEHSPKYSVGTREVCITYKDSNALHGVSSIDSILDFDPTSVFNEGSGYALLCEGENLIPRSFCKAEVMQTYKVYKPSL